MTDRLQHLEDIFPDLAAAGYSPKSEKSPVYNCIAYAAGDESRKWQGYRDVGYYWPADAKEGHGLDALIGAFEKLEYAVCQSAALESDYEKIALYTDMDGLWTHAAKQCEDGNWTSKLGNLEDILHRTPQALAGPDPAYGQVACFMKRKRASAPAVKAARPQEEKRSV
jgi:hypothetical protein